MAGELGIASSVLRYPLNARHPIGFSAGGHLAGQAALTDALSTDAPIDLAVLGYAITSMEMDTSRPARLILLVAVALGEE